MNPSLPPGGRPLIASVFPRFELGGPQVRFTNLANHYGPAMRHAIISLDGNLDCAARLSPDLDVCFPEARRRRGSTLANLGFIRGVLKALAPDVLLTHNWGSMEWAMARLALPGIRHVHLEDGFGPEECSKQIRRRVVTRRLVLRRSTVVLPSLTLLRLAEDVWRLPPQRLRHIPNGLDLERFAPASAAKVPSRRPRLGAVAALRPEKNLERLLRASQMLLADGVAFQLDIIGSGSARERLEAVVAELGMEASVRFTGAIEDPAHAYRDLDVFALSSDTEQMPLAVLEAMASGLPIAATTVGDVPQMVAPENQPFLCAKTDAALAAALRPLLCDEALRARVGAANRRKAEREFGEDAMFRSYAELLAPPGCLEHCPVQMNQAVL